MTKIIFVPSVAISITRGLVVNSEEEVKTRFLSRNIWGGPDVLSVTRDELKDGYNVVVEVVEGNDILKELVNG